MLMKAKLSFEMPAAGARWKDFMMSGIASGIASTAVFPIDLAKTRIQGSLANINGKQYTGIFRTITKVAREEGLLSLFNGCTPVLLGSVPEGAFCIGMNDASKNILSKVLKCPQKDLPLPAEIFAGAFAGFTQIIVTNPMERVKILQQIEGSNAGSVRKLVLFLKWVLLPIKGQAAIELWREDRLAAFYRGVQGRVGRLAPQMAISLMLFELFKSTFSED
ncbi:hypothetical protein GUITHDRAFT_100655 [Guillardia theta CCMP2712]|uniref:Uncharacterized protein n=1 Tax=Guillardia theta (strain CCMP2712) TaxID=905079 RepID=L1JZE4_GUITC|nr:hypothetical protein GUITHDRAFT_100655 [Guillardia theta CCMP2712]EKX53679.1 hypothetical protein GUITHDRAFT_100655 [Guillardia theta CCMP2712]|eukprot:XP_005840659.1 hypothetical protein GUITHDRAFT_100655 [Guillardia theta CCMP2712]